MKVELNNNLKNKFIGLMDSIKYESLDNKNLAKEIRKFENSIPANNFSLEYKSALSVISDLLDQEWSLAIIDQGANVNINSRLYIDIEAPKLSESNSIEETKAKIRKGHLLGVHKQLRKDDIRTFITSMHDENVKTKSIDTLIDNPKELIESCIAKQSNLDNDSLREVIDPYVQIASTDVKDDFTNHKLSDIWRYFRLTWSLEYKTNPGRSLPILIRNRARKNHPVIGISMLASPVLGLNPRDNRMCLTNESFIDFAFKEKMKLEDITVLIDKDIKKSIKSIKHDDLVSDEEIKNPSDAVCDKLKNIASHATDNKRLTQKISNEQQEDYLLFKSKRALKLRKNLERKIILTRLKKDIKKFKLKLHDVHRNTNFLRLIQGFLTDKKTEIMASDVMDLSVCGAVFPYNYLIGGKLVALLMASNEIRDLFDERYKTSDSEIAQKIAGRNLRKKSTLRCLTTTSIYGVGSSQYNRLKVQIPKGKKDIEINWEEVGKSQGYGSYHFSSDTQEKLDELLSAQGKSSTVNYKFGEGTSPRLRKLRESMSNIGFKSDKFFQHQSRRITYVCDLYKSTPHEIYGLKKMKPKNISQKEIAKAWRKRWLNKRILREEIQYKMKTIEPEKQTLKHKIKQLRND